MARRLWLAQQVCLCDQARSKSYKTHVDLYSTESMFRLFGTGYVGHKVNHTAPVKDPLQDIFKIVKHCLCYFLKANISKFSASNFLNVYIFWLPYRPLTVNRL